VKILGGGAWGEGGKGWEGVHLPNVLDGPDALLHCSGVTQGDDLGPHTW
jgi:hypothetical protein